MKTERPWGYFEVLGDGTRYKVKRLVVKPGTTLSLQKHHHRAEHWVVVRGTAAVHSRLFIENDYIFIPVGERHQLSNPGKLPLEVIEVQYGSYLGEDDIVRLPTHEGDNV